MTTASSGIFSDWWQEVKLLRTSIQQGNDAFHLSSCHRLKRADRGKRKTGQGLEARGSKKDFSSGHFLSNLEATWYLMCPWWWWLYSFIGLLWVFFIHSCVTSGSDHPALFHCHYVLVLLLHIQGAGSNHAALIGFVHSNVFMFLFRCRSCAPSLWKPNISWFCCFIIKDLLWLQRISQTYSVYLELPQ